ncbi:ABC transporter permease [Aureimonas flava]|uniref:ABC transporter permease n=1 Tax=Aureimonas flava TaxID=2320271 RepID=A0A3A1WKV4_9HYPH|nr:ABC transporter permease [Aureimonas flava]RIY00880.1 ABC transporter permease [Aureimonas flava]
MRAFRAIALGLVAGILAWQATVLLLEPPRYMLPPPLDVARTLWTHAARLGRETLVTGVEIALGLVLGVAAGMATALATVALPRFGAVLWPQVLILQAMPVFALAPLLVLWFGFGIASKVVMAALIIFFPVASAFADGLRRTDPDLLDATALTEASHFQALWHVRVPLAVPALISGLRVAAPLAPLGAVIGEWVGASGGLGFLMIQANARMQTDLLFAALAILAALTLTLRALVDQLAPRLAPWAAEEAPPPFLQRFATRKTQTR